jgi:hypothetical protein
MRRKLLLFGIAGLAVVGAGAAWASGGFDTPQQQSKAVIDDAAQQLGIAPAKLSDALKKALENRVDAEVAAGTISKAQGDALKARIESGEYPVITGGLGFGGHGRHGQGFDHLSAAAAYLGLSESDLQTQLASGKSLADIAKAQGKSVDGLVTALLADEKKELDAAVAAGRITQAQADQMLANAKQRLTDMVNGTMTGHWGMGPGGGMGPGMRMGHDQRWGGFGPRRGSSGTAPASPNAAFSGSQA